MTRCTNRDTFFKQLGCLKQLLVKGQGTKAEFTVVQKFNQGTDRKRGVIVFGAFFGYLFGQTKRYKAIKTAILLVFQKRHRIYNSKTC